MELIIEPDEGAVPLVSAIKKAKKSVEITIFRFDRNDIEAALKAAVGNGVKVSALIAHTNRRGGEDLRQLEMRFLEAGMILARSSDDLIRYHDKIIVIDRRVLYLLSFNYTQLDIEHSRGFGIITRNAKLVQEAAKLFEADCARKPYSPELETFVVSPANSRRVLSRFLKQARKQLLIYDPRISDKEMIRILQDRAEAGVEIRVIGRMDKRTNLPVRKLTKIWLHARTIIRDRQQAFVGSQSLRRAELDSRREAGLIISEAKIVKKLADTFESDWASAAASNRGPAQQVPPEAPQQEAKQPARVPAKALRPLAEAVKQAVKKTAARVGAGAFQDTEVRYMVKKIVKKAAKEAVNEVLQEAPKAPKRI